MLTKEQISELKKPLDASRIEKLDHGSKAQYVTGWHSISEANRIFGFDGWSSETIFNREVCRQEVKLNKGEDDGFKVGYEAKVRITVGGICKEGTGFGSGIAKDLCDCIEGAAKEAETDATKRALRLFGDTFGLALYDKQKRNIANLETYENQQASLRILCDRITKELSNSENANKTWVEKAKDIASIKQGNKDLYNELKRHLEQLKKDAQ